MDKKGFIIYKSLYEPIKDLSRNQKGELFEAILDYQTIKDYDFSKLSPMVKMSFMFFKNQFDIDDEKYEAKCLTNRENVLKRWNAVEYERMRSNTNGTDKDKDKDVEVDIDFKGSAIAPQVDNPSLPPKNKKKVEGSSPRVDWDGIIKMFTKITGRVARVVPDKAKSQLRARIKEGYDAEDLKRVMQASSKDDNVQANYKTIEYMTRSATFEKYATAPVKNNYVPLIGY